MKKFFLELCLAFLMVSIINSCAVSQPVQPGEIYSRPDSLRGSIGAGRDWWDIQHYDISVSPNIAKKTISGFVDITYNVSKIGKTLMQIDLQQPMQIEKVENLHTKNETITFKREGNVYWLSFRNPSVNSINNRIRIHFSGTPKEAQQPPWDGGWIWKEDSLGRPFVSVACQGIGASIWYPCKAHESDKPDKGASLTITVPNDLTAVGNGRLTDKTQNSNGTTSWRWTVQNPINSYLIIPYIGKYANFNEEYVGEKGTLNLNYWVLDYNLDKAKKQFSIVKPMMYCFEKWMGPYPFYEDSYKLVEAPHLGMEHQSAVAYGNKYMNGYMGIDRSGTGWGKKFDFIVVHESGHEWFGNSITASDAADMWIHEAFTTYSETLFVECSFGLQAANEYVIGQRKNIQNKSPMIGIYGLNKSGSGDMYDKGANMIHTIRQIINNDGLFRQTLRGLGRDFYHQSVTTAQIESYIAKKSGKKLNKVFDQYLRAVKIPVLEYKIENRQIKYRWANCVEGFDMPVKLFNGQWLQPSPSFKSTRWTESSLSVDPSFYINVKRVH